MQAGLEKNIFINVKEGVLYSLKNFFTLKVCFSYLQLGKKVVQ